VPVLVGVRSKLRSEQLLDCRDAGYESHRGHGCSSLVYVVCCVGSSLSNRLITGTEEPYCVCVCDLETPKMRGRRTVMGCFATETICLKV